MDIKPVGIADLIMMNLPTPRVWLPPYFVAGRMGMVYGGTGIGKSYTVLWMIAAAASRGRLWCFQGKMKAKCIILAGEMSLSDYQSRVTDLAKSAEYDIDNEFLKIITPDQFPEGVVPNIANPIVQGEYDKVFKDFDIIVIDNLCTTTQAINAYDNEQKIWERLLVWFTALKMAGKCVIVVHHSGKSGRQLGTSIRENVMDWILQLKRPSNYREEQGARFDLIVDKQRHHVDSGKESLTCWYKTMPDGHVEWEWSYLKKENRKRANELYGLGLNEPQISLEMCLPLSEVKQLLRGDIL